MKCRQTISLMILAILAFVSSCEKAPFFTMKGDLSYSFTKEGGTQSFTFSCNRDWSVSSSESWIRFSPSSGTASDGDISVTITCLPNPTYDPRIATITVKVEELTETISVSQATGLGLIVSPTSYDLTNAEQSIEVEVQQNVSYTIEIDDACKEWIKKGGTKALNTDKVLFNISANTSYGNREGKITFKQTDGDLSQTVVVKQGQTNGLFITTPDYSLSNESHTLSVEVKANVQFEVTSQASWIKYVETKTLTPSSVVLSIEANDTYDNRTGTVLVKQTNGDLVGTITINQKQTDYLSVDPKLFEASNEDQSVSIDVQDNIRYSVVIPDDAKDWISVQSNTQTKALADDKVVLVIAQNLSYDPRSASITIKQVDGPLAETVEIRQAQGDGLFVTTPEYNLSNEAHTLSVELKANVEFEVDSEVEWIKYVETKALSTSTVTLSVAANDGYDRRTGTVKIRQKNGSLEETVTINQEQTNGLFVTPKSFDLTNEEQTVTLEIKDNVSYDIVIPEDAKSWISVQSNTQTKALDNDKVVLAIAGNDTYDEREASLTIKQTDGPLAETVQIKQAYVEGLLADVTDYTVTQTGGSIEVDVLTNMDIEARPQVDWIHFVETKALSNRSIVLIVDENRSLFTRKGSVVICKAGGGLSTELTIQQPGVSVESQPNNVIYYTSTDGNVITPYSPEAFGAAIITNEYNDGKGIIVFDKAITVIGKGAFYNCSKLESLSIPTGVTNIGNVAFALCESLSSINIADTVTIIGEEAFAGCSLLSDVVLPDTLASIGKGAFNQCSSIITINIPNSVTSIGEFVFSGCEALSSFTGKYAEDNGRCLVIDSNLIAFAPFGLNSYTIPAGVTEITYGFAKSYNITSITIPEGVTRIGPGAFQLCTGLTSLSIPSSVTHIGYDSFSASGIESIIIPSNVETIDDLAFDTCKSLKSVIIEDGVKTIGYSAFNNCVKLSAVIIPNSVTYIESNSFTGCKGLSSITVMALNAPTVGNSQDGAFYGTGYCPIYVPYGGISSYYNSVGWSNCASRIRAIPGSLEAIDLGLSVKWAPYNLGATAPEMCGCYFAWGETVMKNYYEWTSYKYGSGSQSLNKYCTNAAYGKDGFTDNYTILESSDDAATFVLGEDYRIPSLEEIRELMQNTTREFTTINGVNGVILTSTVEGFTDKSIFLPAAGHMFQSSSSLSSGKWIEYMSSEVLMSSPNLACGVSISYGDSSYGIGGVIERQLGYPIRPVCKK